MSTFGRVFLMVMGLANLLTAGFLSFGLGLAARTEPRPAGPERPKIRSRKEDLIQIGIFFLIGTLTWLALAVEDWTVDVMILLIIGALLGTTWALVLAVTLGRRAASGGDS